MKGTLYLIPSTLGENVNAGFSIPPMVKEILGSLNNFIVESEKQAMRFLIKLGIKNIQELSFQTLNEHTRKDEYKQYLEPLLCGKNTGIISDAGCPAVADPGSEIVLLAHYSGIRVIPLVGASSVILALMASGMNGQKFSFHGYLPAERNERIKKIKELERESFQKNQTEIFIEAPYRNQKLLEDILQNCKHDTLLGIASEITLPAEFIQTKNIGLWKKNVPGINKKPTVFLIQA